LISDGPHTPARDVFERVVCLVEPHGAGHVSVTLVEQLRPRGSDLLLVGVVDPLLARQVRIQAPEAYAECRADVQDMLDEALVLAPTARTRVLDGSFAGALLWVAGEEGASLIAVQDVPSNRLTGIVLGALTTALLHEARCTVLVARPAVDADAVAAPRSIVVGVDGSSDSIAAVHAAVAIARRCSGSIRAIAATGAKPFDAGGLESSGLDVEIADAGPVEALVGAAHAADLLVVGSRGLHGIRALGSVSERVAHRAPCSVLVVRTPPEAPLPRAADAGLRCRDVMTRDVVTVAPDATVSEAARLLVERGASMVVVVDGDAPVGLVTETDLSLLIGGRPTREPGTSAMRTRPVSSIMASPVPMVDADSPVEQVVSRIVETRGLPVLEEGKLVGMLSEHDLLRALVRKPHGGTR